MQLHHYRPYTLFFSKGITTKEWAGSNSTSQDSKEKGTVKEIVEKKTDVVNHKKISHDDSDTVNQGGDECGEEVDIS